MAKCNNLRSWALKEIIKTFRQPDIWPSDCNKMYILYTSLFEIVDFLASWLSDIAAMCGLWAGGGDAVGVCRRGWPPAAVPALGDRHGGLGSLFVVLDTVRFSGESLLCADLGLGGLAAGDHSDAVEVAQSIPEVTCEEGDDLMPFTTWRHLWSSSAATDSKSRISN